VTSRQANLVAFASALLFGAGLGLSGMTQPSKVQGFLDVTGRWDPSLLFVMGGAIAVHVGFARRHLKQPLVRGRLDAPLIFGAVIFGVGWGMSGYCPGPALVSLASLVPETLIFGICMFLGLLVGRRLKARIALRAPREES
jgi:uncharacterized protein